MSKCMLKKATAKVAELEAQLAAAKAAQEVEAKKVEAEKKKAAEAEKKKAEAKKKAAELKEKADAVRKSLSYISDATALQLLAISQGKPIRTIISDIVRECYDDTFPFSDEDDTTAVCGFLTNEVTIVGRTVAEQLEDFDRLRAATNK